MTVSCPTTPSLVIWSDLKPASTTDRTSPESARLDFRPTQNLKDVRHPKPMVNFVKDASQPYTP
jgi:hypothetical protein